MLLLALDTATEAVVAAVLDTSTDEVVGGASFRGPVAHGEQLAPVVAEALDQAGASPSDLGAIGVGRGPGPYTGLRVGLVHAEVLGWALGIPVHGVCTLDVLAAQAAAGGGVASEFLVVTDARRREVYWARYAADGDRISGPAVDRPADVCAALSSDGSPGAVAGPEDERVVLLPAVGAGAARYPDVFPGAREPLFPDAAFVARLAAAQLLRGEPADVTPLYLRRPDAVAATSRKRVTPT